METSWQQIFTLGSISLKCNVWSRVWTWGGQAHPQVAPSTYCYKGCIYIKTEGHALGLPAWKGKRPEDFGRHTMRILIFLLTLSVFLCSGKLGALDFLFRMVLGVKSTILQWTSDGTVLPSQGFQHMTMTSLSQKRLSMLPLHGSIPSHGAETCMVLSGAESWEYVQRQRRSFTWNMLSWDGKLFSTQS